MKYLLSLIIIFCGITQGVGQEIEEKTIVTTYMKWIPTSLLDPSARSIQLSLEQRLTGRYSLQYGFGYILNSGLYNNGSDNSLNGYRGRFGFRIYRNGLRQRQFSFFHGPGLIARQMFQQNEKIICTTPDCSITQNARFVNMQTKFGVTYGYGWHLVSQEYLSLEVEVLQGITYRNNRALGLPPMANVPTATVGFPTFASSSLFYQTVFPTFHILVKVGFGITPKK